MASSQRFSRLLSTALSAAALCALPALLGCSDDPSVQSTEDHATEFVCTSTTARPGQPLSYFAPFDPVEQQVLCALDRAESEVLIAHYNIRRESYLNKLVELRDRGVDVRVAIDAKNSLYAWNVGDDFLEENGIEVVRTSPSSRALMHLKVTVIDGNFVMAGSFNWNGTASLANDENMVSVADPEVVAMYRNQVLETLRDKEREVEGGQATEAMALHFSPEERLDEVLSSHIDGAAESIDIAMFTFTSEPVADAVAAAAQQKIRVHAVLERKQTGNTAVDEQIEQAGALVVRGANRIGSYSAMHHKYAIIDGRKVITGATNWTYTGTRLSDEDLLIVELPELAAAYRRNFADLLHIYGGLDVDDVAPNEMAGVLFHAIHGETQWGDRVVVTGNHGALGNWDPWRGVVMDTSNSMFPNWTGSAYLPAGTRLEYKYVMITGYGDVHWEPGPNRVLDVPPSGRAVVRSGPYGDTSQNWSPIEAP